MVFDILTLFPNMFSGPFDYSIVKRAVGKGMITINIHDLRQWAIDKRGTVDDRPYGGGVGMIMRIEPIYDALQKVKSQPVRDRTRSGKAKSKIILLDPRGEKFTQKKALEYSELDQLILICGHYEGIDERVKEHLVDESISIGNYILTGGEIPVMVIVDAVTRLVPGVLSEEATTNESFVASHSSLEYPQYTRPENFNGWQVPPVLLSGNHKEIEKWRDQC